MSVFTADEIRAQLRAQKIPEHLIERAIAERAEFRQLRQAAGAANGPVPIDARDEKEIVARAIKQMRALGFVVVNFSQYRPSKQTAGIPDQRLYHVGRGLCFWWEAKTPTGEQSPAQREFQEWCDASGDPYCLGTDRELYAWLLARYPLAWDEAGHLVWRENED